MNWESIYRSKVKDVDSAMMAIQSGNRVYLAGGAGVPVELSQGLTRRAKDVRGVEITHILTFADAPYVEPQYQDALRVNALFIGSNVRSAVQDGRAD
jgi:acyl-CoA hydrolase